MSKGKPSYTTVRALAAPHFIFLFQLFGERQNYPMGDFFPGDLLLERNI
jgi:hypothetical protein